MTDVVYASTKVRNFKQITTGGVGGIIAPTLFMHLQR